MGTVTRGANSVRATVAGVLMRTSSRWRAPANASNPKYKGRRCQGDCSTELKRACGALRSEMLVCGLVVMKLRSLSDAKFRLKPRKLWVRKMELRTSELIASPNRSEEHTSE